MTSKLSGVQNTTTESAVCIKSDWHTPIVHFTVGVELNGEACPPDSGCSSPFRLLFSSIRQRATRARRLQDVYRSPVVSTNTSLPPSRPDRHPRASGRSIVSVQIALPPPLLLLPPTKMEGHKVNMVLKKQRPHRRKAKVAVLNPCRLCAGTCVVEDLWNSPSHSWCPDPLRTAEGAPLHAEINIASHISCLFPTQI